MVFWCCFSFRGQIRNWLLALLWHGVSLGGRSGDEGRVWKTINRHQPASEGKGSHPTHARFSSSWVLFLVTETPECHENTRNRWHKWCMENSGNQLLWNIINSVALEKPVWVLLFFYFSGVFKDIDRCERAAGPRPEMEISHLSQSEESLHLLDSGSVSRGGWSSKVKCVIVCSINWIHIFKKSAGRRLWLWSGSRRQVSSEIEVEENQQETTDSPWDDELQCGICRCLKNVIYSVFCP